MKKRPSFEPEDPHREVKKATAAVGIYTTIIALLWLGSIFYILNQ